MMQILKRAPRSKAAIKIHYHNIDIYKSYCKETGNPHNLTQSDFFSMFDEYMSYITNKIITEGFVFNMPYRLGRIGVFKTKIVYKLTPQGDIDRNGLRVDWNNTFKLWSDMYPNKTIEEIRAINDRPFLYFMNKNTDGYNLRFLWDKSSSNATNQFLYRFKPIRKISRELALHTKDGTYKNDYSVNMYRTKNI